jgi:hypothetical protein
VRRYQKGKASKGIENYAPEGSYIPPRFFRDAQKFQFSDDFRSITILIVDMATEKFSPAAVGDDPTPSSKTDSKRANSPEVKEIGPDILEDRADGIPGGLLAKLGLWLKILTAVSIVILFGAVGLLSWLWWGSRSSPAWRMVMLTGWVSKTVTLSSTAIRTALSALAGICTSMIAAIAVERRGVPLMKMAQLSIARFTNNGPNQLAPLIFGTRTLERFLRIIAAILLLNTILSQFVSTLLVSDLQADPVITFPYTYGKGIGFLSAGFTGADPLSDAILNAIPNYYGRKPSAYEAFAEFSEAPSTVIDGVDDTGRTVRAFLPFSNEADRLSLQSYSGPARVLDARTVCVRPDFTQLGFCAPSTEKGPMTLCGATKPGAQQDDIWYGGNADPQRDLSVFDLPESLQSVLPGAVPISCPLLAPFGTRAAASGGWELCPLPRAGLVSTFRDSGMSMDEKRNQSSGRSYLLWNAMSAYATGSGLEVDYNSTWKLNSSEHDGAWLKTRWTGKYKDGSDFDVNLQATWCFDTFLYVVSVFRFAPHADLRRSFDVSTMNITASSSRNRTEPECDWDNGAMKFDTVAIRRQLGATNQTLDADTRGILAIDREKLNAELGNIRHGLATGSYTTAGDDWLTGRFSSSPESPIGFCSKCTAPVVADSVLVGIFYDALEETRSPAKAVQAYKMALLRMAYHDFSAFFSDGESITTTEFRLEPVPVTSTGYFVVVACIAVQLALFALLTFTFSRTAYSLPKNAWHAVAQITESAEAQDILRRARVASDKEIEAAMGDVPQQQRYQVSGAVFTPTNTESRLRPWLAGRKDT